MFPTLPNSRNSIACEQALDVILPLAKQLLREVDYEHHPIRLIGLSVSNPREESDEKGVWEQLSFEFSDWELDE